MFVSACRTISSCNIPCLFSPCSFEISQQNKNNNILKISWVMGGKSHPSRQVGNLRNTLQSVCVCIWFVFAFKNENKQTTTPNQTSQKKSQTLWLQEWEAAWEIQLYGCIQLFWWDRNKREVWKFNWIPPHLQGRNVTVNDELFYCHIHI